MLHIEGGLGDDGQVVIHLNVIIEDIFSILPDF
jgi:hypothetical protein